ncbi:hypothetical protein ACVWWG_005193 [Bradyrhizobium sp. LB7.2]
MAAGLEKGQQVAEPDRGARAVDAQDADEVGFARLTQESQCRVARVPLVIGGNRRLKINHDGIAAGRPRIKKTVRLGAWGEQEAAACTETTGKRNGQA